MNIIYQFLYFVFALLFLIFAGFICGNFQFKFFAFLIISFLFFCVVQKMYKKIKINIEIKNTLNKFSDISAILGAFVFIWLCFVCFKIEYDLELLYLFEFIFAFYLFQDILKKTLSKYKRKYQILINIFLAFCFMFFMNIAIFQIFKTV